MSDDPAELAVRRRLYETFGWSPTSEVCRTAAAVAVEAARPIIEAPMRDAIAMAEESMIVVRNERNEARAKLRAATRTEPEG